MFDEISLYIAINLCNGGPCHTEISPLICFTNQWTGFYMIGTSVKKELMPVFFCH